MTDILTLTLNPALDVLTSIDKVEGTHKMRCAAAIEHPGGGGVNVARVLHRLGASCVAAYLAGGVTGQRHHQLMRQDNVRCHLLPIAQETRESFSVHENSSGQDFRFVLPGPTVTSQELEDCFDYVATHLPQQFLVISGGMAPGVPLDFYARLTRLAQQHGLPVVLDANGPALHAALQEGVFLFKPQCARVVRTQRPRLARCDCADSSVQRIDHPEKSTHRGPVFRRSWRDAGERRPKLAR